jgi:CRISPR-associated protein Cas2
MLVIVLENVPERLGGRLSLWFLEVRAGVFVGRASPRLRDRVWDEIRSDLGDGNAVMIEATPSEEAGFRFRTAGKNRRMPLDSDGFPLVGFRPLAPSR